MDGAELTAHRGDVVLVVVPGDYGKPRPAVVVQSDLFNDTHASLTVCPVTSSLIDASLFRLPIEPSRTNGLDRESQIMVDKIQTLRRDRLRERLGALDSSLMAGVDAALKLWLRL